MTRTQNAFALVAAVGMAFLGGCAQEESEAPAEVPAAEVAPAAPVAAPAAAPAEGGAN